MIEAILLAAGQGRRFGGNLAWGCKVLIEVHGHCLLDRHFDALFGGGVDRVTIVVGYQAASIEQRARSVARGRDVRFVHNPRFQDGSLYSLSCANPSLAAGHTTLVMDADVLYDPRLIRTLVDSPRASGLLFDGGFLDEEMKVGLRGGKAVALGKKLVAADFEGMGRGPGFYKLAPDAGHALSQILSAMVDEGHAREEYEDALTRLFRSHDVWPIDVGDMAWTEIDHAQDLARAENEIWPRITAATAAARSPHGS